MADTPATDTRDDEIDLNALLGALIDHKWFIGVITCACFVLAVAYALLATPIYQANGLLQVEQKVPDLPGLSAITQTLGASNPEAATEIAIIKSRSVIGEAVKHLNLDISVKPHRFPVIGGFIARHYSPEQAGRVAAPWLGISRDDWGGSKLEVFQLDVPGSLLGRWLTVVAGRSGRYTLTGPDGTLLRGRVGEPARGHGVTMQVAALSANPGMRFSVTRKRDLLTILYLQQRINADEQGKDSGIIQTTYENANPKLAVATLNQVQQAYVLQNVAKNSEQAANSLAFVKQQLPQVRENLDQAQAALNAFQVKAHSVDITLQTKSLLDQVVGIDTSIQHLKMQQADVARRFTKAHPAYKALLQQIGSLNAQKSKLEQQIDNLPDTQKQLLQLTEDVRVSNTTYTGLLNQAQQLEIARAGTVGNVRVVDPAAVNTAAPVAPRRGLIILVGTLLGLFLSVACVLVRKALAHGVEDPAEIERLGLPVYAAIPASARQSVLMPSDERHHRPRSQCLLTLDTPADLAVEALRSLRTSLHFARVDADNNVLMIAGCGPMAGKTFISTNLAAVVAQAGDKVLLIDADLRRGSVHRVLGVEPERGLSELISGQVDLADVIREAPGVENLHFIPRGKVPPNPSELLMRPAFKQLLALLSKQYDMIIVDSPPILAVTDAAVVGQHAGTCLLVVRFGVNQSREIALAKQRFEQNGVRLKGAVFNAVQKRASGYYSYGYYEYASTR